MLQGAVQGIAELITRPGMINVDFADVRTVMAETGMAMMGSGSARGENRAREAAEAAVSSPLLEDVNLQGAHGLLINVTAGLDLRTSEFSIVGDTVKQYASEDANVVVGCVIDPEMTRRNSRHRGGDGHRSSGMPDAAAGNGQPSPDDVRWRSAARGRARAHSRRSQCADLYPQSAGTARSADHRAGSGRWHELRATKSMLDIPAFLRRQAD